VVQDIQLFFPAENETSAGRYPSTLPSETVPSQPGDPIIRCVIHELNNLMGVINVYSELLTRGSLDEGQRQAIDKIRGAAGRAGTVAQKLLDVPPRDLDRSNGSRGNRAADADRTSSVVPVTRPHASGARILVVEDNEDTASGWQTALQVLGYEVRVAHDGPEAIRIAAWFMPLVALVDIGLPDMSGYQVANRLLEQREPAHPLHLVAVTGYGYDADRKRSGDFGFAKHLVKPVDLSKLANVVKELAG
jgi:CheY-like chemotaxis protein